MILLRDFDVERIQTASSGCDGASGRRLAANAATGRRSAHCSIHRRNGVRAVWSSVAAKFVSTTSQGVQEGFFVIAIRIDRDIHQRLEHLFVDETRLLFSPDERADFVFLRSGGPKQRNRCPCRKLSNLLQRTRQTDWNEIVGVFPTADDGEDIAIEFASMASDQIRKQCVAFLFVHNPNTDWPSLPRRSLPLQNQRLLDINCSEGRNLAQKMTIFLK